MNRIWSPRLQQYEIICDKCKKRIIEDEVRWFNLDNGDTVCESCYKESFKIAPDNFRKDREGIPFKYIV